MKYSDIAFRLPRPLKHLVLHFEVEIDDAVARFAAALQPGSRMLDAGAGEGQYAHYFAAQRYCGIDLAVGSHGWDYSRLDALADLTTLPFRDACFESAVNIVTLEHVNEPGRALQELSRVLTPGGHLLLVVPHEWEVHLSPHDYFRYTRHGLEYLLARAGFGDIDIIPAGGYFRLLARRLLNGLKFFTGGLRWIWFAPAALLLVPPALVLPFLDGLDHERNFTLGYICTARKRE